MAGTKSVRSNCQKHASVVPQKGKKPQIKRPGFSFLCYAVIALSTTIAYSPVFSAGFIWNDELFIEAPQVQEFSGIFDIWFRPQTMVEIHYWPVTYTSFWLDYRIWGDNPFGYHLHNVILHIVNACLVRNVLIKMGVGRDAATFAALLFALHPLNVESVAWAIERKDVLSGLFYLASLLLHPNMNVVQKPSVAKDGRILLSLVLYMLGVLSKSMVVSLPAILLLVPWMLRGRISWTEMRRSAPFFVAGLALAAFDVNMVHEREPMGLGFSFWQRALIACRAVCFYASKLIWPGVQMMVYPRWDLQEEKGMWIMTWIGFCGLRGQLGRGPIAALLFFVITLSPTLGFVDFGWMHFSFVAERFQYLACLGPLSCFAAAVGRFAGINDNRRYYSQAMAFAILLVLASRTRQHASRFVDKETYFSYMLHVNPIAKAANLNLGNEYMRQQRYSEAAQCFEKAIELEAEDVKALTNYGIILSHLKQHEESIMPLMKAIEIDARHVKALNALGNAMSETKQYEKAVSYFHRALQIDGSYSIGWCNMGNDLTRLGRYEEAIESYEKAIAINPSYTNARIGLGLALSLLNRHNESLEAYKEVQTYDPGNVIVKERIQLEMAQIKPS